MKKIFTIIAIFIQFCVFASSAWAYDGSVVAPSGQTIYYNFDNTTSTITITVPGYTLYWEEYPQPTGALVIPDSITHNGINYPVTSIGYAAFRYCSGLTSVSLPSTVTEDISITAYFAADSTEGINGVLSSDIKVYSVGSRIVIEGADGETVHIFDMMGREIFNCEIRNSNFEIQNSIFPTGVYIVKVGCCGPRACRENYPARKVTVIR